MTWYRKEYPTPFDAAPPPGLFYLDGRRVTLHFEPEAWTEGYKYPMLAFPSGAAFVLQEGNEPNAFLIHLFGHIDLPLRATCEETYGHVTALAEMHDYLVERVGDDRLELLGPNPNEHYQITFAEEGIADIAPLAPSHVTLYA